MQRFTHNSLDYKNLKYGFFTRNGGVSKNPYGSLNCSFKVNDNINNVHKNLRLIKQFLKLDKLVKLNQIHSSKVCVIDKSWVEGDLVNADGLVTNLKGIGLSILGADCAPIIFYDSISKTIGACHAGWRGTINNILEATITCMESIGAKRKNIESVIGPMIHKESYIIREDVAIIVKKNNFLKKNNSILLPVSNGEYFFDLATLIKDNLKSIKIKKINNININTYKHSNLFFSHRRTTHNNLNGQSFTGRQISIIGMSND